MVRLPYKAIPNFIQVLDFITSIFTHLIWSYYPLRSYLTLSKQFWSSSLQSLHTSLYGNTYYSPSSSLGVHPSHLHTPHMVTLPYIVILIIVLQAVWGFIVFISHTLYGHIILYGNTYHSPSSSLGVHHFHLYTSYSRHTLYGHITLYGNTYHSPSSTLGVHRFHLYSSYSRHTLYGHITLYGNTYHSPSCSLGVHRFYFTHLIWSHYLIW